MQAILQRTLDSIARRVKRSPFYYQRYNNTLDFRINEAYLRYARECAAAYVREHPGETLAKSPLTTEGAMRLKGVYPPDKARALSARITELIQQGHESVDHPRDFSDLQIRILKPLRTLGAGILDVLKHETVHRALLSFFQGNYRIEWVSAYRSIPAKRKVSSWLWHSDSYPPRTVKLFLHLTPATAETGATDFMNLQDTMAYRRAGYFGQYLGERYADLEDFAKAHHLPYRPFHFDAEPGDATIFDMNFFHRAVSPCEGRYRDVVQIFLLPSPIPWEQQLKRNGIDALVHTKGSGYPKDPRKG